ncbi:Vigilin-like 55, partial [Homarus americanus]
LNTNNGNERRAHRPANEGKKQKTRPLDPWVTRMRAQWVEENITESVKAPNSLLGAVIGPGGSIVKELQNCFKVRVLVPRKGAGDEPILIEGKHKNQVRDAALRVKQLIQNEEERRRVNTPVSRSLSIPKAYHSKIIGFQGQNIRHLTSSLKIHIMVPHKYDKSELITLTGLPQQVDQGVNEFPLNNTDLQNTAVNTSFETKVNCTYLGDYGEERSQARRGEVRIGDEMG